MTALKFLRLAILVLCFSFLAACLSTGKAKPGPFNAPMESRLILQVPFHPADDAPCAASALAAVMTYNGRPTIMDKAAAALEKTSNKDKGREMVLWSRREGLKAEFFGGTPEQIVAAVQASRPVIVRLDRPAEEVPAGSYAVVVGYTPDGPVLNSCEINQRIVPWSEFLAAWHKAGNLMVVIESL